MGQSQTHVTHPKILNKEAYMEICLDKPFYYAGTMLQGTVHINCNQSYSSTGIKIMLIGKQVVYWMEEIYPVRSPYTSSSFFKSIETYKVELKLASFESHIEKGQYSFPFTILLPQSLPSSVNIGHSFIRYEIIVEIQTKQEKIPIKAIKNLQIREPPREFKENLQEQKVFKVFCCGMNCFSMGGSVGLFLATNVAFIQWGKAFKVWGIIDNSFGIQLAKFKIVLRQQVNLVSKNQQFSPYKHKDFQLYQLSKVIQQGSIQHFQTDLEIPKEFKEYTAIGNIVSRVYFLTLIAEPTNTYFQAPSLQIHTLVVCPQNNLSSQPLCTLVKDWNPTAAKKISFFNLTPYIYNPSPFIKIRNQCGDSPILEMQAQLPQISGQTLIKNGNM